MIASLKLMKRVATLVNLIGAVALIALAIACASDKQTEDLLSAAGFKIVPADTPQRQANLKTLPANKTSMTTRDGKTYFIYPDPAHNVLYVGQQDQYNQYQKLRVESNIAQEQLNAAEINADNWGWWGPWGPY